jgi:hypothetical protein
VILQILFVVTAFIGVLFLPAIMAVSIALLPTPPTSEALAFVTMFAQILIGLYMIHGILGIIFTLLWFRWRRNPCAHKTGFMVTGALGLVFGGLVPGLLVLIAGRMIPREEKA